MNHRSEGLSNEKNETLAAIYARVSYPNQSEYSLDEQIDRCRELCNMMGWKVRYVFRENGASGGDTDRPKFQVMMKKVTERRFDVLVFWRLDRLCRSLVDLVNTERELRRFGVSLYSITERIDTTTSVGRFNFRNLASAAELERDLIRERVKMGKEAMARKHKWPNKKSPLGYEVAEDQRLVIKEDEAHIVRRIFSRYIELRSMARVAYELNREGILTKAGMRWSARAIKKILDNEIYVGIFKVAGVNDHVENYRIIDDDTFMIAKSIRNECRREHPAPSEDMKKEAIDRIFREYLRFLEEEPLEPVY
jgi:site-specific DNA recombinase